MLIRGSIKMLNARKPHFLEVFLPNLSSNRLKVPSKFVEHLGDRTSGSVSLIGPSGNEWHVNLCEYNGHLFFREGWPTFVKDHAIECGDTLIFGYDGNSKFTVQIFDESSCEKDEALYANCSQGASKSDENLGKRREIDASLLKIVAEKNMRGSWVPAPQVLPAVKVEQKLKKCIKKSKKFKKTKTSGYSITPKNIVEASDRMVVLAIPALTPTDIVNFHVRRIASKVKRSLKKKQNKEKTDIKKLPSISKFIESRAAHYFTSTFPYFVRVMCYSNINGHSTLKIPTHFSSLHLPNCRTKVTLMNLNGDCWIVNSIPTFKRSTTMHTLCGGWIAFVRANDIKLEDVCIFELVGEFELRVRILRLGLEGLEFQLGSQSIVDVDVVGLGGRCLDMIENVAQDIGDNPSKALDEASEPYIQQEAVSSIDTVDNHITTLDPSCGSASSMGTGDDSTLDELLLLCNDEGTISYQTSGNNELNLEAKQTMHLQPSAKEARDTLPFTSPFPNFMKVMMSSNVGGSFTLNIPRKFSAAHLPSHKTEVILRNLRGDSWSVVSTRYGKQTKFCGGWMSFARKNNVKVGDICVFELLGDRELQVRVFDGSQKVAECVNSEAVVDDSMALVVSTESGLLSES